LGERIKLGVDLILRNGTLVSNEVLKLVNFLLILGLQSIDVLFRDLYIRFKLEQIDEELSFVGQLLLVVFDYINCTRVLKLVKHVEEHGVTIRLFHDFTNLSVKVANEVTSLMVDDFIEGL